MAQLSRTNPAAARSLEKRSAIGAGTLGGEPFFGIVNKTLGSPRLFGMLALGSLPVGAKTKAWRFSTHVR